MGKAYYYQIQSGLGNKNMGKAYYYQIQSGL